MRRRATIGLALAWAVLAAATATPAQGEGRGQGAIVVRDDAPIYTKSEGDKIIAKVARGYAVGGIGFKVNSFVAEIENGRAHILYLGTSQGPIGAVKGSTEKNALGKRAWMNQDDLAFFNYECGCGEKSETCAAIETAGWISERWNQCFIEARDKKLAELKAGWEKGAAGETSGGELADSSRHASSSEKALTNGDVVALVKAGLGDEVIVSKVQQAPRETLDVSTDALIQLKKDGVSKAILDAMVKKVGQRK